MKEKTTFFVSFYEAAKCLPNEQRLAFYDALFAYAFNGEETSTDPTAMALMQAIKPVIDKTASINRMRSDVGAAGVNKRWDDDSKRIANDSKRISDDSKRIANDSKRVLDDSKRIANDSGIGIGEGIIGEGIGERNNLAELPVPLVSRQAADAQQHAPKEHFDYRPYVDFFNQECDRYNAAIPRVTRKLTDARAAMLRARVGEHGPEAVFKAFTNAAESSFLNGGGPRGWKANIDWILRPNNFAKVLEGTYANNARAAPAQTGYEVGRILTDNRIDKYDNEETKWE